MRNTIKAVVDTNVILSVAIGSGDVFTAIYKAFVQGAFIPVFSERLINEVVDVLTRPRLRKYLRARELNRFNEILKTDAIFVSPSHNVSLCRDPRDNFILETALEAKADMIITRDADLLVLNPFRHIEIIPPKEFLKRLK